MKLAQTRLFLTFLLPIGAFTQVSAQTVHLYHNLHRDSTWYKIEGKRKVKTGAGVPLLKKGSMVELHLVEYNDFVYDLSIDPQIIDNPLAVAGVNTGSNGLVGRVFQSSASGSNIVSAPLGMFQGALKTLQKQNAYLQNLHGSRGDDSKGEAPNSIDNSTANYKIWKEEATNSINRLKELSDTIKLLEAALVEESILVKDALVLEEDLVGLTTKTQLAPSQIVQLADQLVSRQFGAAGAQLNLDKVLAWPAPQKLRQKEQVFSQIMAEVKGHYSILNDIGNKIEDSRPSSPEMRTIQELCFSITGDNEFENGLREKINEVSELRKDASKLNHQALISMYEQYLAIRNHSFEKTHSIYVEGNAMDLVIKLSTKELPSGPSSSSRGSEQEGLAVPKPATAKTIERRIRVNNYDPIKFSTNMGICFSNFFKPEQEYAVRDQVIVVDQEEFLRPLLFTGITAYSGLARSLTPGISAGIGIPVLSNTDGQSISYVIGPSLVLGKSQSVVVNAGIMAGKARRLKSPNRVNDGFGGFTQDLPTEFRMSYGWFFGVAINLP